MVRNTRINFQDRHVVGSGDQQPAGSRQPDRPSPTTRRRPRPRPPADRSVAAAESRTSARTGDQRAWSFSTTVTSAPVSASARVNLSPGQTSTRSPRPTARRAMPRPCPDPRRSSGRASGAASSPCVQQVADRSPRPNTVSRPTPSPTTFRRNGGRPTVPRSDSTPCDTSPGAAPRSASGDRDRNGDRVVEWSDVVVVGGYSPPPLSQAPTSTTAARTLTPT